MALWQFITFTALLGALLVYAGVITRRLGSADARLNRIEEALLAKSGSLESADTRVTDARPEVSEVANRVSEANPEVSTRANEANPEVSSGKEGRRGYLTIHDLRARSEQRYSRAAHSGSGNSVAVPERRDALKAMRGLMESPGTTPERESSVVISSESREIPATSGELVNLPPIGAVSVDFEAAVSLDSREVLATGSEPLDLPAMAVNRDSEAVSLESREAQATGSERMDLPTMAVMHGDSETVSLDSREVPATSGEPLDLPTVAVMHEDSEAVSLESREVPATSSEPVSLPTVAAVNEDAEAASLESRDAPATNSDRQDPPRVRPVSDDPVAKKNRDIAVFMNNQRRRRRARLGY